MPRPGPSVTSGADLQPGSDSLFPSGFTGGGARPSAGSVGTGEIADGSVAATDLNLSSVATALAGRSEFTGTYAGTATGVRLRQAAARAAGRNAIDLGVTATPPTISTASSNGDTTLTKTYRTRTDGIATYRFAGGTATPAGGAFTNFYTAPVVTMPSGSGGNTAGDATHNTYQWSVEFMSDAPRLCIRHLSTSVLYMLEVDDQPVSQVGLTANAGGGTSFTLVTFDSGAATITASTGVFATTNPHGLAVGDTVTLGAITTTTGAAAGVTYYVLTVPSSTTFTLSATLGGAALSLTGDGSAASVNKSKVRKFRLEYQQGQAFDGVLVDPRFSVWKPQDDTGVVVAVVGDSIENGTGTAALPNGAWNKIAGKMLGWVDVRQISHSGTGFINAGASLNTFGSAQRIADTVACSPDVVIIPASQNDDSNAATVQAAALTTFRAYRVALPSALIVVMGADPGSSGPSATRLQVEAATLAAFNQWGDAKSKYIAVSNATDGSWFTGTGYAGATTGTGNRDRLGFDTAHPNTVGHHVRARRFVSAFRQILPTL